MFARLMAFDACTVRFAHPRSAQYAAHTVDVYTWRIARTHSADDSPQMCDMCVTWVNWCGNRHHRRRSTYARARACITNHVEFRLSRPLLFSIQRYAHADATHPLKYEWVEALRSVRVRAANHPQCKDPNRHPHTSSSTSRCTGFWLEQTIRQERMNCPGSMEI